MKFAISLGVAFVGAVGSVCHASQFVLVTRMEATAQVGYLIPGPNGSCDFDPSDPDNSAVSTGSQCSQLLTSESGLAAGGVGCAVFGAPPEACPGNWGAGSSSCSWNGHDELYMDGNEIQGQLGGGGSASATVRFLRRTFVEVETDGTCPNTPCNDTTYQPGSFDFYLGAWEWYPWKRLTFVPLPLDINADDVVNDADVAAVIAAWGDLKQDNFADTNLDGRVDAVDLVRVLSGWGGDGRE